VLTAQLQGAGLGGRHGRPLPVAVGRLEGIGRVGPESPEEAADGARGEAEVRGDGGSVVPALPPAGKGTAKRERNGTWHKNLLYPPWELIPVNLAPTLAAAKLGVAFPAAKVEVA
jgi:hypothetical protein